MVGAVGLAGLALFAEAQLAVGLDGEGGGRGRGVCGQGAVAIIVGGAAGGGEDGGGVAPIGKKVERDARERNWPACPGLVSGGRVVVLENKEISPSQVTRDGVEHRLTSTKTAQVVRP